MARTIVDIGVNDSLLEVIKKVNYNFRVIIALLIEIQQKL